MSAPGTVLVWICAALAAMPLSPCAFFSSVCRLHEQAADVDAVEVDADAVRSCCAEPAESANNDSQPQRSPCQGECCRISPFVLAGEKLLPQSQPIAPLVVLPLLNDLSSGTMAPLAVATVRPLSLHILHCRWRC